ncbi:MAG: UDP-N-acetylmuramate--L-alanine ligase [Candidatus Nealsonbacteria bacterium]|nr:UDP-N-acetylmuramate--L-alanine ligase [Candidatus Nealsonbacteria bacterium]
MEVRRQVIPAAMRAPRRAHLVGIAGAGMRAMATVLRGRGWPLSGSDRAGDPRGELAAVGIRVRCGHAAENLPEGTDLVVYSDAVPQDNPELQRAAELGIPRLSYFEMIGRLMTDKHALAVAGTHGKSTTTAMAAEIFVAAGRDPTVLCGAASPGQASGGRHGRGEILLAEACEYRANFLHLRPQHAVVTGIEPDHFDYYRSRQELEDAFAQFVGSVPPDGLVLARHDCPTTQRITADLPCRVQTFGLDAAADWSARLVSTGQARYQLKIYRGGQPWCGAEAPVRLPVPGKHNVLNALAAAALAGENGVPPQQIARGLERFAGLRRRFEPLGIWRGVLMVDDYAHHPTEVAATLATVRRLAPGRRVWCVFQPHQASRTEHLLDELAESLQNADRVLVAEIFRAREGPPGSGDVTAADLAREVLRRGTEVWAIHDVEAISRRLAGSLTPGDVLITLGAGDIRRVCDGLIDGFREDRAAG